MARRDGTRAGVRLSGRFSPGQKVALFNRYSDTFDVAHAGKPLAQAKVAQNGLVMFDGLDAGQRYWIAGEDDDGVWRGVAMTAKEREIKDRLSEDEIAARLAQTRPASESVRGSATVTGARNTTTARAVGGNGLPFANAQVGVPTPKAQRDPQPAPYARIEDAGKVPLRSHTITGEAHVVNPDLPDGKLRQDQVPDGTPQASSTPLGEATIIGDEDQATARLENKVPPSQAAGDDPVSQEPPNLAGIEAAQAGKPGSAAKRSAHGKTPGGSRTSSTGGRKASPRRRSK